MPALPQSLAFLLHGGEMGEMCDFEAEYFPRAWGGYNKRGKSSRVNLSISLSKQQREKVRLIGGVAAVRKLIDSAPIPAKPETEND